MKKQLAHTVWERKYHVVWVPEKRRKIVYGRLRQQLGAILRRLGAYKGVEVIERKLCIDRSHVCLAIPPQYSASTIAGYLRDKSAVIIFEKYSRLKKNFRGHGFWARGYYVSSVGLDESNVREYIRDQELNESAGQGSRSGRSGSGTSKPRSA